MIFNDELDKSLYLILENDSNNCNLICNFLKDIPIELYSKIRIELSKFKECSNLVESILELSDDFCLRGSIICDGVNRFSFIIDMIENSLIISREILIDNKFYKDTEIKLNTKNNYNDVNKFGTQSLGYFKNYLGNKTYTYDLVSTMFGNIVFLSYGERKKRKKISSEIDDLDKYNSKYGLSRVRKMS